MTSRGGCWFLSMDRWCIRGSDVQSAEASDVMEETLLSVAKSLTLFDADRSDATFRG